MDIAEAYMNAMIENEIFVKLHEAELQAEPATSKAWWRQSLTLFLLFLTLAFLAACGDDASSSTLVELASPCKTESEDSCEYGELEDSRDGQTYKTVTIGTQTWMAENLNFKTDSSSCYDNEESNCIKYGRLYTWAAAIGKSESKCGYDYVCSLPSGNIQGACPSGWHLPSDDEWLTLFIAVGSSSTAGKVLKSTSDWKDDGNGTDAFGFSALPAGYRYIYNGAKFSDISIRTNVWSSTEYNRNYAYAIEIGSRRLEANLGWIVKNNEASIRCLKD